MIRQIPVKLPKSFEDALGYPRNGYIGAFTHGSLDLKWVAFYWEPAGDETMYDDGYSSGDCNWGGFLQFVRHPRVAPWLSPYDLGSSDSEAKHWLLCNLETREVYVGERVLVNAFLADELKKILPAPDDTKPEVVFPPEDIGDLLAQIRDQMQEVPVPGLEEIREKMRQQDEAVDRMIAELG